MVLTPRRWRQAGESRRGWQESPVTRESAKKTVNPSRGECRAISGVLVVTNARVLHTPRAAAGASGARHSLRPLNGGREFQSKPRAKRAARSRSHAPCAPLPPCALARGGEGSGWGSIRSVPLRRPHPQPGGRGGMFRVAMVGCLKIESEATHACKCTPLSRPSSPAKAGDPVVQRRR